MAALEGIISESVARGRFVVTLFGIFTGPALSLASVGICGVLAYAVGQLHRRSASA